MRPTHKTSHKLPFYCSKNTDASVTVPGEVGGDMQRSRDQHFDKRREKKDTLKIIIQAQSQPLFSA